MTGRTSIEATTRAAQLLAREFEVVPVPGDAVPLDVSVVVLVGVGLLALVGLVNFVYRYGLRLVGTLRSVAADESAGQSSVTDPTAGSTLNRIRAESDPEAEASPPLTDEERVLQLLEDNDGQLPQSDIVAETPWSKSKVSRLLARMDVQDQIVKINAGRRNVILLPEAEPPEVKPPSERESETR